MMFWNGIIRIGYSFEKKNVFFELAPRFFSKRFKIYGEIYMNKLIVANWKGHPATEREAIELAKASDFSRVVICPPHQFLEIVQGVLKYAVLGVQDYAPDAHDHGAQYAIIGHSDQRAAGDTASIIAEKMALAVGDGLIPILCVGEHAEERAAGAREAVIRDEIAAAFALIRASDSFAVREAYIAYEPVWAISAVQGAKSATPAYARTRIAFMKEYLLHSGYSFPVKFLYGGSVTSVNAGLFLREEDIGGLLIGAASVRNGEIKKIWQEATEQAEHTEQ